MSRWDVPLNGALVIIYLLNLKGNMILCNERYGCHPQPITVNGILVIVVYSWMSNSLHVSLSYSLEFSKKYKNLIKLSTNLKHNSEFVIYTFFFSKIINSLIK